MPAVTNAVIYPASIAALIRLYFDPYILEVRSIRGGAEILQQKGRTMGEPWGKLAYVLAKRIANDILERGWIVGERLGAEADLLKRYKVSREPFRAALRILERQGIVRAERGWKGGLIVQAPALTAVSQIIKTYIEFADFTFDEVYEAHLHLSYFAIEQAVQRMNPAHANDIRRPLSKPRPTFRSRDHEGRAIETVMQLVYDVANNPCLSMLLMTCSRVAADFGHQERYPKKLWDSMVARAWQNAEQLARSAINADLEGCMKAAKNQYDHVIEVVYDLERSNPRIWNSKSFMRGSFSSALLQRGSKEKAATALAYRLLAHIRRQGLLPGTPLGTESGVMREFGVSRAIFREAVRLLEFFGVVETKRGGSGGLTVSEANPALTTQTAVLYLRYFNPEAQSMATMLHYLENCVQTLAAERAGHTDVQALIRALLDLTNAPVNKFDGLAMKVRQQVVGLSENRALGLIIEVVDSTLMKSREKRSTVSSRRTHVIAVSLEIERIMRGKKLEGLKDAFGKLLRGVHDSAPVA